jgi:hypothetical protein
MILLLKPSKLVQIVNYYNFYRNIDWDASCPMFSYRNVWGGAVRASFCHCISSILNKEYQLYEKGSFLMKHVIDRDMIATGKHCIETCERAIDVIQKLSEVCAISMKPECAELCGKSVRMSSESIDACNKCIEHCQNHIFKCDDMHCKKRFQACIEACEKAIQACNKLMPLCHAYDVKCIPESISCVAVLQQCALACQAAIGG